MQFLALHGFTGRGSDFKTFAELIGGEWHCPDLPGHGPDPQLDCTPVATIEFLERELATSYSPLPTSKNILIGYSLGGRAALQHAVAYPEVWDALILIIPNPGIEDPAERAARRSADEALAQRIERHGALAFIEFWKETPMIRSQKNIYPEVCARMAATRQAHTTEGLAASLRQFGQGTCPNLWPELNRLNMPLFIISGEKDHKYTEIAKRIVNARCTPKSPVHTHTAINNVGHMPQLEAPEVTAKVIRQFLNTNL